MLCAFSFASCSSDDEVGSTSDLVGCWLLYSEQGWEKEDGVKTDEWNDTDLNNFRLFFYEDGSGKSDELYRNKWSYEKYFYWSLKGSKLTLIDNDADNDEESCVVKTLNKTTLIIEYTEKDKEDGVTYEEYNREVYKRISD
jgi:hypothetical protein